MTDVNATDMTFADLGLPEDLLAAVTDMGFEHPTAIQAQAIPHLLAGSDVLGVAQTGTGKTAAFGLPLLATIDPDLEEVQALVLAPTRELAMQGADAMSSFAARSRNVDIVAVYGGSAYGPQLKALKSGAQVVVGTPGRIMDLMDKGALTLDSVRFFVLDEADEMLRMGFAEDVDTIAQKVPAERVTALFSATMPASIRRVAERHLSDPVEVTVSRPASTVSTITQRYAVVPREHKTAALARVLAVSRADAVLVFVATRAMAEEVSLDLGARGIQAAALSGDVAQKDREKLVARLRSGQLDVIVATDVAARGLDVERIGLVVNFDVPRESDTYVHRIGRTGRAGREGEALTFVTPRETARLRRIQKATKAEMEETKIPALWEVSRFRALNLIDQAHARAAIGGLDIYADVLTEYREARDGCFEPPAFSGKDVLGEQGHAGAFGLDAEGAEEGEETPMERTHSFLSDGQLLTALLALLARDDGNLDGKEPEVIGAKAEGGKDKKASRKDRRERRVMDGATRYRLEVGHRDRVRPGSIVGALTKEAGLRGKDIGHIDIFPTFCLVDIAGEIPEDIWNKIGEARVAGRKLRISIDRGPQARRGGEWDEDDHQGRSSGFEGSRRHRSSGADRRRGRDPFRKRNARSGSWKKNR